jgi:nucleotide-binding universal stress UspA family protein
MPVLQHPLEHGVMQNGSILVPLDLSSCSLDTLVFTQQMAIEFPVHVILLNVVSLNVIAPERRLYDELFMEAENGLRKLGGFFFGSRQALNISVRMGRPHKEIVAEAESKRSQLIIMSSPKPSRWRRMFGFGTVEGVIRDAPCPTLVIPRDVEITQKQCRQAMRPATAIPRQSGLGRATR